MRRAAALLLLATPGCVLLVGSYDKVEAGAVTGGDPGLRVDAAVDAATLDGARDAGLPDGTAIPDAGTEDGPAADRALLDAASDGGDVPRADAPAIDAPGADASSADAWQEDAAGALGRVQWLRTFGSTSDGGADSPGALAVGNAGEIYLTGEFDGPVQVGSDPRAPGGAYGLVLAKYDRDGDYLWSRIIGERTPGVPGADKGQFLISSLALDTTSRPLVGGAVDGQIDLGDGLVFSDGYSDVFLDRVAADNSSIGWGFKAGGADSQLGRSIAFGGQAIGLTGYFNGTLGFVGCQVLTSFGRFDLFVAKFDQTGGCTWSRQFGSAGNNLGLQIALDSQGRIALLGQHQAELDLDGHVLAASSTGEHFLAWLDASGTAEHALALDTLATASIAVAMDSDGDVYVAGSTASGSPTTSHALVRKYAASHTPAWEVHFAGSGASGASAIDVDALGRVLVTGSFSGQVRHGSLEQTSDDVNDAFVALLDGASGSVLGLEKIGGAGDQGGVAIRHDPGGGVVVLGGFTSSISAGQQPISSLGGMDVFLVRLGP